MRARLGVGVFVTTLGLLLGWLLWEHERPQAEEVRLEPAMDLEEGGPTGVELASVLATRVVGERAVLEHTMHPSPLVPGVGARGAPLFGGLRASLWVKVVDEQHAPIEDVRVALRSALKPGGKPESVGTSDAEGLFGSRRNWTPTRRSDAWNPSVPGRGWMG